MAKFDSFGKAFRSINGAVKQGSVRALNRAVTSTKAMVVADLRSATGLKKKDFESRVYDTKATQKKLRGKVWIGIKAGIPIDKFSPKEKKVIVSGKRKPGQRGRPKSRTYYGVTAKIGNQARQLIPGGFLRDVRGGKTMVLGRKQAFNSSGEYVNNKAPRLPTVRLLTKIFSDAAKAIGDKARAHMQSVFDKNIDHEIGFALSKQTAPKDDSK